MAAVINDDTEEQLPLHYEFQFAIREDNTLAADTDVFSSTFTHQGDVWLLELNKLGGNNELQSDFKCKLGLISSASKGKIAYVYLHSTHRGDFLHTEIPEAGETTFLFKSGDHLTIGTFRIDESTNLSVFVKVVKYTDAMPKPKRTVQIPKSTWSAEVRKWLENGHFGDVTIVATDGKKLRCHRDFLARRSEVFRLMFNSGLSEAKDNLVNIDGYDGEIVAALLAFIYVDNVDEIGPIADRVYAAAHQYELVGLKNLCETSLAANLSEENVVKTRKLVELYRLDNLLARCVDHQDTHKSGKSVEEPSVKRPRPAEPMGLTITSSIFGNGENEDFPAEYGFECIITLDKVVLNNYYSHNGDVWQLEVEKSGVQLVRCQLHLVDTTNETPKFVCITTQNVIHCALAVQYRRDTNVRVLALFNRSGDSYDFGLLSCPNSDDVKFGVQLIRWQKCVATPSQPETPKSQFASDVIKWFQSEDFGDTTLVAKGGTKYRCHRDILTHRSEVFRQQFNSGMSEAEQNVVNMEDFDGEIVASLLSFIYTDECGEIGPIADHLYAVAVQYRLVRLKNLCEFALAANLSADTIVKTYKLANTYHLDNLMASCDDFLDSRKAVLPVAKIVAEAMKVGEEPKANRIKSE